MAIANDRMLRGATLNKAALTGAEVPNRKKLANAKQIILGINRAVNTDANAKTILSAVNATDNSSALTTAKIPLLPPPLQSNMAPPKNVPPNPQLNVMSPMVCVLRDREIPMILLKSTGAQKLNAPMTNASAA